jgi:hypothetical protein
MSGLELMGRRPFVEAIGRPIGGASQTAHSNRCSRLEELYFSAMQKLGTTDGGASHDPSKVVAGFGSIVV